MSGIPQTRKLWITPLSPVHMGTDEDYTPTSYVIEGDALYEFDQRALENLPDSERKRLNGLLDGEARPEMLKEVQAFFHRNRERLIPAAVNVVKVSAEMAKLYENRVGKAANVETDGRQVLNALEIERACYNPTGRRLMLPGSGLKGAMRTALLDAINDGRRPENGERNRDLQQRVFQYTMRELHKDPMRLVHIGDCAWHGPESVNSAEVLFAVNRKKHPVVDENGNLRFSQAENLYQLLECAAPFRFRAFRGTLNISDLGDTRNVSNRLPKYRFSFGEIAKACNRFYRPIFDRELALLKKRGFLDSAWRETTETLLSDASIRRRLENNDAFLLRVGRHSGAESVTLNGVRSIRIMRGKGQPAVWQEEAKTVWLATAAKGDRRNLRPFGWLLVEMTELDDEPAPWPQAEELMERYNVEMAHWLEAALARRRELEQRLTAEKERSRRRAQEEVEREAREREAAQRMAALSEEERQMEELRGQLERDRAAGRKEPGGVLNEKRLALLESALQWSDPELRKGAAALIRQTAEFLPWSKKRKNNVFELLAELEEKGA